MASFFRSAWRYSLGGVLGTVASLISFPVLTRLLSVEDYGLMSTVAVALAIVVAACRRPRFVFMRPPRRRRCSRI
jgi:O-antigen/teichoic acid export membrane protein